MTETLNSPASSNGVARSSSRGKAAPAGVPADVELSRLPDVLDSIPTRVMLADRDFTITYVNRATLEGLEKLREFLPVTPEQVVGSNLDIFHKNPAYQRGLLATADHLPRRAYIHVGPETLDLNVAAIRDDKGEYVGAMATWDVVTEKLELEKRVAQIGSMRENSPTNMMFADREFVIRYMNPASLNTLRGLEAALQI